MEDSQVIIHEPAPYHNFPLHEIRHVRGWRILFYIYPVHAEAFAIDWVAERGGARRVGGRLVESDPLNSYDAVAEKVLALFGLRSTGAAAHRAAQRRYLAKKAAREFAAR